MSDKQVETSANKISQLINDFINKNKKHKTDSLEDLVKVMDDIVNLVKNMSAVAISMIPMLVDFFEFVASFIKDILSIINNNHKTIEILVLAIPVIPFSIILYKLITRI